MHSENLRQVANFPYHAMIKKNKNKNKKILDPVGNS